MSRVLVVGTGPLLGGGVQLASGQCLRTWHFTAPLLAAGHEVRLLTVPIPGTTEENPGEAVVDAEFEGFSYRRGLVNDPGRLLPRLEEETGRFGPDAVVGVNAGPAWLLARTRPFLPFWADLNGWTMAEGQVRAATVGHDRDFVHFWRMEAETALVASRFSTVTGRQADALYGELAMLGRLSRDTFEDAFAVAVPNAVYPAYRQIDRAPGDLPAAVREKLPEGAFVVLWSGGFNSWTDLGTLAGGLGLAFEREPRLHLVCTGGAVSGHDEETYGRFQRACRERLPAGRVLDLGWVDFELVLGLHRSAHLGLNVDGPNTESRFGARNRLTNMMGAGLPVLTTRGTEIADWIERRKVGLVVPPRQPEALAEALVEAARGGAPEELGARGRALALEEFAPEATLPAFLEWARAPRRASDQKDGRAAGQPPEVLGRRLLKECSLAGPSLFRENAPAEGVPPSQSLRPLRVLWRNIRRTIQGGSR